MKQICTRSKFSHRLFLIVQNIFNEWLCLFFSLFPSLSSVYSFFAAILSQIAGFPFFLFCIGLRATCTRQVHFSAKKSRKIFNYMVFVLLGSFYEQVVARHNTITDNYSFSMRYNDKIQSRWWKRVPLSKCLRHDQFLINYVWRKSR